ncbi:Serine/threonine protein phosphatase 7 long form isogeny [Quillaja saponaria]|uniref:Serine/threonine protein phosphatase 7 long form isogeny n=1 Tax=Quillaja saponaria TaxID=32244 RepID=A0AAD7VE54_QUISA|nr:Serine/threonine protein phosphatase 7 long form isogeny [Quillaja saponaria]
MLAEQFISLPYIDDKLRHLIPNYCYRDQHIWGAKVPLICFHIVEYQKVDRLMPDFAQQSSEVFNSPILQVPYFQYGSTPASYDLGMGSGVQAEEGFSRADDIPMSEDFGDTTNVPPRRNPARRRRPRPCGT